jgi:hypothetical protein
MEVWKVFLGLRAQRGAELGRKGPPGNRAPSIQQTLHLYSLLFLKMEGMEVWKFFFGLRAQRRHRRLDWVSGTSRRRRWPASPACSSRVGRLGRLALLARLAYSPGHLRRLIRAAVLNAAARGCTTSYEGRSSRSRRAARLCATRQEARRALVPFVTLGLWILLYFKKS